jgi:hypothetical protein
VSAVGFFKMKKLKGSGKLLVASRHNKCTIQAEHGAAGHIDAASMDLNRSLHGPDAPEVVAQHARALMAAAGVRPQKKNAVLGIEQVFSLPAKLLIDREGFFRDCLQWTANHFGGIDNVLSADIHLDESAPHMHVLLLPLVEGRMNGSALFGNRQRLLFLQNDFHAAVAGRYGLAKAPARLQGLAKEKTAQAIIRRLQDTDDTAQKSALWPVLRDMIDRDPVVFAQTLGIDIATTAAKPMRTMVQIMTSKGKGSQRPAKPIGFESFATPIGLDRDAKSVTLSCVGVARKPAAATLRRPPVTASIDMDDRVVDRSDCDFLDWQDDCQKEQQQWP